MSIKQKNSDTAAPKGSAWKKNVIFALVVLALAAGIFLAVRAQHPAKGSGFKNEQAPAVQIFRFADKFCIAVHLAEMLYSLCVSAVQLYHCQV